MTKSTSMPNTNKSNLQIIMETIHDLHNMEQVATRERIADLTGFKLAIIDDRVADLIDNGHVVRIQRGVFEPAQRHPPARIISKTYLPGGITKIEIGDDHVITLTPREDRYLANLMGGSLAQFASVEVGHHAAQVSGDLSLQMRQLRKRISELEEGKEGGR